METRTIPGRPSKRLIAACLAVLAAALLAWTLVRRDFSGASNAGSLGGAALVQRTQASKPLSQTDHDEAYAGASRESALEAEVGVSSTPGGATDTSAVSHSNDRLETFRAELEAALVQRMNPNALLSEAQRIADLDLGLKALAQPTIDGGVRLDFLGEPDGLIAGLEVGRSANFANIVTMEVQCEQKDATFLEGAFRGSPTMRVKIWSDSEGRPSNLVIRAELPAAYRESLDAGIDINSGTTTYGLRCYVDLLDSSKSTMSVLVMKDGMPTDGENSSPLVIGGWPDKDKVEQLASTLLALQKSFNN